jgi:hypothetical protein
MRQSNNPKRRIADIRELSEEILRTILDKAIYVGSALHKRNPSDYGFHPPVNPRPHKSLCDDPKVISIAEARKLLEEGVRKGLVSTAMSEGLPKFVWSVDAEQEVYEAKLGNGGYHGYRLNREDERFMRDLVLEEWKRR